MRKNIFLFTLPIALMSMQLSASNLNRSEIVEKAPARNIYLDYANKESDQESNISVTLDVLWTKPVNSGLIGYSAYRYDIDLPAGEIPTGSALEANNQWIPAFKLGALYSIKETGKIFFLTGRYQSKPSELQNHYPDILADFYIDLPNDSTRYPGSALNVVTVNNNESLLSLTLGMQAYTLQWKNFGFTASTGLYGEFFQQEQGLAAVSDEKVYNLNADQQSFSGGLSTVFSGSIILAQSDDSALYVTTKFTLNNCINHNTGSVVYDIDDIQDSNVSLRPITFSQLSEQSVALTYAAIGEADATFQLSAGLSLESAGNRNLISKYTNGYSTDEYSPAVFVGFIYTM